MMSRAPSALVRRLAAAALGLAVAIATGAASASVRRSGTWPAVDHELVSFSAENLPRAEAIRRLANKAGWSVVVQGATSGMVDVQVTKQPAAKVLELILGDGRYVARRDGDLVSIAPVAARADTKDSDDVTADATVDTDTDTDVDVDVDVDAAAAKAGAPRSPGAKTGSRPHGKDRVVTGSSVTIGRDEVVGDLVVLGGSAEVLGQVSGDVSVFAGSLQVREGGHVFGDVATFGGSIKLDQGSRVDGDLSVLGGSVDRHDGAVVGGHSKGAGKHDDEDDGEHDGEAEAEANDHAQERSESSLSSAASTVGSAITHTALLFAFGAVLWALAGLRIERLQTEAAARPMRSFALGLVGMIATALAMVVLCVTVIGIPIAIVAGLVGVFGAYAGVCAALTAAGAALVRHRTSSPYIHLALGCAIYVVLSSLPFVGHFVTAAMAMIGFGALVATRGAGLIKLRRAAGVG
jgi:hypothetical protein